MLESWTKELIEHEYGERMMYIIIYSFLTSLSNSCGQFADADHRR